MKVFQQYYQEGNTNESNKEEFIVTHPRHLEYVVGTLGLGTTSQVLS